jgi:hypothetical protein
MHSTSKMKIKGLSSSNQVAGEGILHWLVKDADGNTTYIELLGYHIPNAGVRLLSPQVLLKTIGGHGLTMALPFVQITDIKGFLFRHIQLSNNQVVNVNAYMK